MLTVVLDDDPTGTQCASKVRVVFGVDRSAMRVALERDKAVYIQTNSRAIDEGAAVELVKQIKVAAQEVAADMGDDLQFILRGDSTLRGHVFAESYALSSPSSVLLFVPAFPAGGRRTRNGIHYVRIGDTDVPAADTEYAQDPVFPFKSSSLVDYVREKTGKEALQLSREVVADADRVAHALLAAPAGTVVVADVEDDCDIRRIADGVRSATKQGADLLIRSAAPLAAELAGVSSNGYLQTPLTDTCRRTLVVCGSHTQGATEQLALLAEKYGDPVVIPTDEALADPVEAGNAAAVQIERILEDKGIAIVCSERIRRSTDNTLEHGEAVMAALTTAVSRVRGRIDAVVTKGGITSADVARVGLEANGGEVLGQVFAGVSVWKVRPKHAKADMYYIIVPGNVGGPESLLDAAAALTP